MIPALEDDAKLRKFAALIVWGQGGKLYNREKIERRLLDGLRRIAAAQKAQEAARASRKPRQLVSGEEAVACSEQPKKPCSDCPFARASLPGWLGNVSAEEWVQAAHGEALVDCHALAGPQCAGIAIYRANVCKKPRDHGQLVLPPDRKLVFATPAEFIAHHRKGGGPWTLTRS